MGECGEKQCFDLYLYLKNNYTFSVAIIHTHYKQRQLHWVNCETAEALACIFHAGLAPSSPACLIDGLWGRRKWKQQGKIETNCGKKFILSPCELFFSLSLFCMKLSSTCDKWGRGQRLKITEQSSNARVQPRESSSHFLYFMPMLLLH